MFVLSFFYALHKSVAATLLSFFTDILERQHYDRINKLVIKADRVVELNPDMLEAAPEWTQSTVVSQ